MGLGLGQGRGALAWLSHMSRLTRMVRTLHTLPMTEKDVAEMTARSANEKYDMPSPAAHASASTATAGVDQNCARSTPTSPPASVMAAMGSTASAFCARAHIALSQHGQLMLPIAGRAT